MSHMRFILSSAFCLLAAFAVAAPLPQGGGAPKNLKVLKPTDDIRGAMRKATQGLGVRCDYCHAVPDFAADDNPKKLIARHMFEMTRDINAKFPDGKEHVTCYTCHRGAAEPLTAPAAAAPKQ
jgi:Photosynthetic reaction centre cytochrome C subunit